MTNIDKIIETLILDNVNQDCGCTDIGKYDLKKFALDIQKETARKMIELTIENKNGKNMVMTGFGVGSDKTTKYPALEDAYKQLTGEDYE